MLPPMTPDAADPATLEPSNGGLCPVCYHWVRIRSNFYVEHPTSGLRIFDRFLRPCPGSYLWASD